MSRPLVRVLRVVHVVLGVRRWLGPRPAGKLSNPWPGVTKVTREATIAEEGATEGAVADANVALGKEINHTPRVV